eukprot:4303131-Pyramimonas_sp.AAC.1
MRTVSGWANVSFAPTVLRRRAVYMSRLPQCTWYLMCCAEGHARGWGAPAGDRLACVGGAARVLA